MGDAERGRTAGPPGGRLVAVPLRARLSADALHLQVFLAPDAAVLSAELLAGLVREESARLGVLMPFTPADLALRLRTARPGTWTTLLSGTSPTAPVDGVVELLGAGSQEALPALGHVVREGMVVARLHPPVDGQPGRDVLGCPLAARAGRVATLPRGENTYAAHDGLALHAARDGRAVLREGLIHVVPMQVYEGDVTGEAGPLAVSGALAVRGSIRGTRVRAGGDVIVDGDVDGAHVESTGGAVAITGRVSGSAYRRCTVRATGDIGCTVVADGDLRAGGDLRLREARNSLLEARGDLVLGTTLARGLHEATLELGSGVVPVIDPADYLEVPACDRQHVRVATRLEGAIALHERRPLVFRPCTLVDLSTSGVRCRLSSPLDAGPHALIQLKFALPGSAGQVFIIARESRAIAPGVIGLSAVGMTQDDQHRLREYCLQLLLARKHSRLPTRDDRGGYQ